MNVAQWRALENRKCISAFWILIRALVSQLYPFRGHNIFETINNILKMIYSRARHRYM